jgi:hypothetical protein
VPSGDIAAAAAIVRDLATSRTAPNEALAQDRATIAARFDIATMARGVEAVYRRLEDGAASSAVSEAIPRR